VIEVTGESAGPTNLDHQLVTVLERDRTGYGRSIVSRSVIRSAFNWTPMGCLLQ